MSRLTTALSGVLPLFGGQERQNNADSRTDTLGRSRRPLLARLSGGDLNLFCLEYVHLPGSRCTLGEPFHSTSERWGHVGLSIRERKAEVE